MSVLKSEEVKLEVAQSLLAGESQESIARRLGTTQSAISKMKDKPDMRAMIEREGQRIIDNALPGAVDNVISLVKEMPDIPKDQNKRRELSYKATQDALRIGGLMPSPVQSTVIQNIYGQNTFVISPLIQKLLDEHKDAIDVDWEEGPEPERRPGDGAGPK